MYIYVYIYIHMGEGGFRTVGYSSTMEFLGLPWNSSSLYGMSQSQILSPPGLSASSAGTISCVCDGGNAGVNKRGNAAVDKRGNAGVDERVNAAVDRRSNAVVAQTRLLGCREEWLCAAKQENRKVGLCAPPSPVSLEVATQPVQEHFRG